MEDAQSVTAPNGAASDTGRERRVFPPPRKLSDEQEVEVTRLYAETNTPIADIAGRFGIGESSVYRVAKRHGAALRGRVGRGSGPDDHSATPTAAAEGAHDAADGATGRARGRRRTPAQTSSAETSSSASSSAPAGGRRRSASADSTTTRRGRTRRGGPPAARSGGERRRFRVSYLGVVVVEATGIRDALAKAESQGATEVTSVNRED
jgi:transposase-like protein